MKVFLTDKVAAAATLPIDRKDYLIWDTSAGARRTRTAGFGLRVSKAGAKSWLLNYRIGGRERRLTIGEFPAMLAGPARAKAEKYRAAIKEGVDPLQIAQDADGAPTMAALCGLYENQHLPSKRASSQRDDKAMIRKYVLPTLGRARVAKVTHGDVVKLFNAVTARPAPIRANRLAALLSKMFNVAIRAGMRADNPAKGIVRNGENRREMILERDAAARLWRVLAAGRGQQAARVTMLALWTGARKGELFTLKWGDLDRRAGWWIKPSAHTKQKREHAIPLAPAPLQLLAEIRAEAAAEAKAAGREPSPFVFPSRDGELEPLKVLRKSFATICRAAQLPGGFRFHDLRHQHASTLASSGASLATIGRLLGHTQPATTARYSHFFADALERAVSTAADMMAATASGKPGGAQIIDHPAKAAG